MPLAQALSNDWLEADDVDPFTMLPDWVLDRTDLSHGAFRAYTLLRSYLRRGGRIAFPSRATLAFRMGLAKAASVDRFLDELETAGMIRKAAHVEDGPLGGRIQRSNRYLLAITRPLSPYGDPPSPENGTPPVPKTGHEADEEKQTKRSTLREDASRSESLPGLEPEPVVKVTSAVKAARPDVGRLAVEGATLFLAIDERARADANAVRVAGQILAERPGETPDTVLAVLRFALADEFWSRTIISWPKFREKFVALRLRASTSGPAAPPERPTAPTWDPSLAAYFSGSYGENQRRDLFLSRSIHPSRWYDDGRDQEALLRRALASPVVYAPGDRDHHLLVQAFEYRAEGRTLTGAVPTWREVRV